MILIHHGGSTGIILDFVVSRTGEMLNLASNKGSILGRSVIAPASCGIPLAMPYWSGPGEGLWSKVASVMPAEMWDEIERKPGRLLTLELQNKLLAAVFKQATRGVDAIICKSLPLKPDTPFVQLDPTNLPFFSFDLVTEEGSPRNSQGGRVIQIRVVAAEKWDRTGDAAVQVSTKALPVDVPMEKRRGPKPMLAEAAAVKMLADLRDGKLTEASLKATKQKQLVASYGISRTTAVRAVSIALHEFRRGNSCK